MRHSLACAAAALALLFVSASPARAAEVRLAQSPDGAPLEGVIIEGRIAPGDFVKFASLVLATPGANIVWLASSGGNLQEALRIGGLIRELALEVRAPVDRARPLIRLVDTANNTCASACFFLFAAGVNRQGAVLGIHRPSLPANEYFALGLDGSAEAHRRIEEATAAYLDLMGVPARYWALMLRTRPAEVMWLSPEEVARDLTGLAPGYAEQFRGDCRDRPGSAAAACSPKTLAELQAELRQRTRRRLLGSD